MIPILNREREQIATMRESLKAKPTLICEALNGLEEMEGEVLGGKGISMDLLHRRLGHTSQGGMDVRYSATYLYIIKDNSLVGQSCHLRLPNNWRVLLC